MSEEDGFVLLLLANGSRRVVASRWLPKPDHDAALAFNTGRKWAAECGAGVVLLHRDGELARFDRNGGFMLGGGAIPLWPPEQIVTEVAAGPFYHPTPDFPASLRPPSAFSPTAAWEAFREQCRAMRAVEPAAVAWLAGAEGVLSWREACPAHLRWWN
ncbi:MAG: hypothetical protein ACM3W4_10990 [Ignavibacteriales bacterium]